MVFRNGFPVKQGHSVSALKYLGPLFFKVSMVDMETNFLHGGTNDQIIPMGEGLKIHAPVIYKL